MKKLYLYLADLGDGSLAAHQFYKESERDAAIEADEESGDPVWDGASRDIVFDPNLCDDA